MCESLLVFLECLPLFKWVLGDMILRISICKSRKRIEYRKQYYLGGQDLTVICPSLYRDISIKRRGIGCSFSC